MLLIAKKRSQESEKRWTLKTKKLKYNHLVAQERIYSKGILLFLIWLSDYSNYIPRSNNFPRNFLLRDLIAEAIDIQRWNFVFLKKDLQLVRQPCRKSELCKADMEPRQRSENDTLSHYLVMFVSCFLLNPCPHISVSFFPIK